MNNLTHKNSEKNALDYLEDTLQSLLEVVTGLASSGKKEWALSIGYLLQRVRGGNFLQQLLEEINKYKNKGKIKNDYLKTEQSITCLQEFLDFIDKDSPDEIRFKAMKDLYLTICTEKLSNRDDILPHQLLKICRELSSAELLLLFATYDVACNENWQEEKNKREVHGYGATVEWTNFMLSRTGLKFKELIRLNEDLLIQKRLLTHHVHGDGSGFAYSEHYRLTELGYHLCQFIKGLK